MNVCAAQTAAEDASDRVSYTPQVEFAHERTCNVAAGCAIDELNNRRCDAYFLPSLA
jgi:hypothetical protein